MIKLIVSRRRKTNDNIRHTKLDDIHHMVYTYKHWHYNSHTYVVVGRKQNRNKKG